MRQAQQEFMDWHGTGMSIMEISHRSKEFIGVAEAAEENLRDLLKVPRNYHLLFMHGGSQGQFSAIPMNIIDNFSHAAYVHTGVWSGIALEEANRLTNKVKLIACSADKNFTYIPDQNTWAEHEGAAYLHYVDNETVHAVEFPKPPKNINVPLVVDMSSNLLTRSVNVEDYGIIYACAQKNLGPSGITLVIIRDDLLDRTPHDLTPRILNYRLQVKKKSMVNTPPTYSWYMVGLVAEWVKAQDGLDAMDKQAKARSKPLYDYLDQTEFYHCPVDPAARSRINVIFFLHDEKLNEHFLQEALESGMSGLKGHRVLGGMRASMYNAMPQAGADQLLAFMKDFEKKHG